MCYNKHPYHSYGFLAGVFFFLRVCCQQICSFLLVRSENPGVYAGELRPRAKPGYVHSLSCDPVKFSQDLGRANLTLASTQNRRLLASKPTSELHPVSDCFHTIPEILTRRVTVDQAEGICHRIT